MFDTEGKGTTRLQIGSKPQLSTDPPLEWGESGVIATLEGGRFYEIRVDYFWFAQLPQITLTWSFQRGDDEPMPVQTVPPSVLYSLNFETVYRPSEGMWGVSLQAAGVPPFAVGAPAVEMNVPSAMLEVHLILSFRVLNFRVPLDGRIVVQCAEVLQLQFEVTDGATSSEWSMPPPLVSFDKSEWKSCTVALLSHEERLVASASADFFAIKEGDICDQDLMPPARPELQTGSAPDLRRQFQRDGFLVEPPIFFLSQMSRSLPTANVKGLRRSEGT